MPWSKLLVSLIQIKLMWYWGFSKKKDARDKDEMKRLQVHIRKGKIRHVIREKSQAFYYWCCNFHLDQFQKQEYMKWYSWVDEEKIYCLTNCSPPPMEVGVVSLTLKFKLFLVTQQVINWPFSKMLNCHVWLFLIPTMRVDPLLLITKIVEGGKHIIPLGLLLISTLTIFLF